ncbi:MAG: GH92 family glycosyl hydrolase [Paludibacter sp.]|nr:GH92 family glycosyl hydrolase [Paludibacter sp.]
MKNRIIVICFFSGFLFHNSLASMSLTDYVDLFMCTAGDHGQMDPSATVPFGMIKPGPDTYPGNHSGYNYDDRIILGFSHNRLAGVGCNGAGGNLRMLPLVGKADPKGISLLKETEKAEPDYYKVQLSNGIIAELTATNQTAFHRYVFPASNSASIMIDAGSSFAGTTFCEKEILNSHEFSVRVSARNVCGLGRYTVYYHVWCSKEFTGQDISDRVFSLNFKTKKNETVLFHVTVSSISCADAKDEWETVTRRLSFDNVRNAGSDAWESVLSKIIVEGKEEYKRIFYTHLYHTFLNPVKTQNHSGIFRGTDGELHHADGYTHYNGWSVWDNFRNKFSLYALIAPDISNDIANSLVSLYRYGIPYWSGYNEPVPTVRTEHTEIALLDLYRRGIRNFDIKAVYRKLSAEIGNVKADSPDSRLELCYDYWALSEIAGILGLKEDQELFLAKAMEYKNIWRKKFQAITDNFDVMHAEGLYEGTLWQYQWHVQFDIPGLIELMGGKDAFTERLEYYFDNNLHNQGNQPDIHVPYLFNFSSKPWLTQKWVNRILTKDMVQHYGTHVKWKKPYIGRIYKDTPDGYIPEMDDDDGTMSAWYVLSAIGLYPVLVGEPVFQITSPIFDKITIKLSENKEFVIKARGFSDVNFFINKATLNGKDYLESYILHHDIVSGGMLEYDLSDKPDINWSGR